MALLPRSVRIWLHGLLGAAISSVANSVVVMGIDPKTFNFYDGLPKLAAFAAGSAIIGAMLYLQKHPVWQFEDDDPHGLGRIALRPHHHDPHAPESTDREAPPHRRDKGWG